MSEKPEKNLEKISPQSESPENDDLLEKKNLEKFRINYLSFKTSFPETSLKTVCPICSSIPDIRLSYNSEKGHYVKCMGCRYCYCCSHPRSKTLDDYISIMAKIQQENIKCEIHKEKGVEEEGFFSCEICQKWMCEECVNNHLKEDKNKNHYYYIIRKLIKDPEYNTKCRKHNLDYSHYVTIEFAFAQHKCDKCNYNYDEVEDLDISRIPIEEGECYFNQLKQQIKKEWNI